MDLRDLAFFRNVTPDLSVAVIKESDGTLVLGFLQLTSPPAAFTAINPAILRHALGSAETYIRTNGDMAAVWTEYPPESHPEYAAAVALVKKEDAPKPVRCPHPNLPNYDANPTMLRHDNYDGYARYATGLDKSHPGWEDDNRPEMAELLAQEALMRRDDNAKAARIAADIKATSEEYGEPMKSFDPTDLTKPLLPGKIVVAPEDGEVVPTHKHADLIEKMNPRREALFVTEVGEKFYGGKAGDRLTKDGPVAER